MYYYSRRAHDDIDDSRLGEQSDAREVSLSTSLASVVVAGESSRSGTRQPGTLDKVDRSLSDVARRRAVIKDLWDVVSSGQVLDVVVDIECGVMPFLYWAGRGEGRKESLRCFWGTTVPFCHPHDLAATRELILLGSLDNMQSAAWREGPDAALKIGHGYPSDPSSLCRLLSAELEIDRDPEVQSAVKEMDEWISGAPGEAAQFARDQTERAREVKLKDPGYAGSWVRENRQNQRVVAVVSDVSEAGARESVVLARPVLITSVG